MPNKREISRRTFLARSTSAGQACALAVALPLGGTLTALDQLDGGENPTRVDGRDFQLDQATSADFAGSVGSRFRLETHAGRNHALELIRVEDRPPMRANLARVPFSLIFRASGAERLGQETYRLSHPRLGSFALFLVAIGPPRDVIEYEAVFG